MDERFTKCSHSNVTMSAWALRYYRLLFGGFHSTNLSQVIVYYKLTNRSYIHEKNNYVKKLSIKVKQEDRS
jgi:hypothetical protein